MRKFGLYLSLLLCSAFAIGQTTYTDNFTGTGNLASPPWTVVGTITYGGNSVYLGAGNSGVALYTGGTFAPDQSSQMIETYGPDSDTGPMVRANTDGSSYKWFTSQNIVYILGPGYSGVGTVVSGCPSVSAGDNIKLSIVGWDITCYNITTTQSAHHLDDAHTLASGVVGFGLNSGHGISAFVGTSSTAGTGPTLTSINLALATGSIYPAASTSSVCTAVYSDSSILPCSGGVYSSATTGVATANSSTGVVTGVSAGTSAISYLQGGVTSNSATVTVVARTPQTFYVRQNGGSRYTTNNPTGTCDGLANVDPTTSAADQHCAFGDMRSLFSDQWGYNNGDWAMFGGDTAIIVGQVPFRVAGSVDASQPGDFGFGSGPSVFMSSIPNGPDAAHPTRIMGENFASCNMQETNGSGWTYFHADPTKTAKVFGGQAAAGLFNVSASNNVVIACLDITDHAACANGISCNSGSDYANNGIMAGSNPDSAPPNSNVTLQDLDIHGLKNHGIFGAIGDGWVVNRVRVRRNGQAGWDFDPAPPGIPAGHTSPSQGLLTMFAFEASWNGCGEEFPMVDAIPVLVGSCAQQNVDSGGYGDGIGTPPMRGLSVTCDHCSATFNTEDGFDFGHGSAGDMKFTDGYFKGNTGGNLKFGPMNTVVAHNNVIIADCGRNLYPIPGTPVGFNQHLGTTCRAGDGNGFNFLSNSSYLGHASSVGTHVSADNTPIFAANATVGAYVVQADAPQSEKRRIVSRDLANNTFTVDSPFSSDISGQQMVQLATTPASSTSVDFSNNTMVGYVGVFYDDQCMAEAVDVTGGIGQLVVNNDQCPGATVSFKNNINIAYNSPNYQPGGHQAEVWGANVPTTEDYNVFYGFYGNSSFCTGPHDICLDPLLTNEPNINMSSQSVLDDYVVTLTSASPAKWAGTPIAGVTADYLGNASHNPPSIGAAEFGTTRANGLISQEANNDWMQPGNAGNNGGPSGSRPNPTCTLTPGEPGVWTVAGADSYSNCYWFRVLGTSYNAINQVVFTLGVTFPTSADVTNSQGVEAEVQSNKANKLRNAAIQLDLKGTHKITTFDYAASVWVPTTIPVPTFVAGVKHTFGETVSYGATDVTIVSIQLDGTSYPVNITRPAVDNVAPDTINTAFQLDSIGSGVVGYVPPSYTVNTSDMNVTLSTVTAPPPAATVTGITFSSPNPIVLTVPSTVTPTCTVAYSDSTTATCISKGVVFSSSNTSFATVNSSTGVATPVAAGSGTITATLAGTSVTGTDAFTVTASAATLSSFTITASPSSVTQGGPSTFSCVATYSDGSHPACPTITYTASGATFSGAVGTFATVGTITVTGTGGGKTATSTVTVTAPPAPATLSSITLSLFPSSIPVTGTSNGTCTLNYSDNTHPTCSGVLHSSTGAATVNGLTLTGASAGISSITYTQGGITSNAVNINVTAVTPPASLNSVTLTLTTTSILTGGTSTISSCIAHWSDLDRNCTGGSLASSSTSILGLNGITLIGLGAGQSTVTYTQAGVTSNQVVVTVAAPIPQSTSPATGGITIGALFMWMKIGSDGSRVSVPWGAQVRYGAPLQNLWSKTVSAPSSGLVVANSAFFGGDPAPQSKQKEMQIEVIVKR